MYGESTALPGTIEFFKALKKRYQLRVIAVSNEGRELNDYRITAFKLNELFDAFISSCFVHLRKPDKDIFRMASDISQTTPMHSLYIDDRSMFVEVAQSFGMNGLHYKGLEEAKATLKALGFEVD
jgi:HAD superfamily hydrolase (TIGR01509 family)